MEDTDAKIVALLATDGRMSYTDIGRATGLSTSAAQQRVRRLEQRGVITGYRAQIASSAVGRPLTALVEVRPLDPVADIDYAGIFAAMPALRSCYSLAGDASFLLEVAVTDPEELERVLAEIRRRARVSTQTSLVLSVPFRERAPL